MKLKTALIYLRFLVIGFLFIGIYNLFHWTVFTKLELLSIRKEVLLIGIPFALVGLLIFIFLRPRIELLKINLTKPLFYFSAGMAILIPNLFIAEYLSKASGKLTELPGIRSIDLNQKSRYYSLKHYSVSKENLGAHMVAKYRGRHSETLDLTLYLALPLYGSITEKIQQKPPAGWLGIKYNTEMKSSLSAIEKETKMDAFLTQAAKDLQKLDPDHFAYFEKIDNSYLLDSYKKAVQKSPKFNSGTVIVLHPFNHPFEARIEGDLKKILTAYFLGALFFFIILIFPKLDQERLQSFNCKTSYKTDIAWRRHLFFCLPKTGYVTTPLLLVMNILIFVGMAFTGAGFIVMAPEDLLAWGANYRPYIDQGNYWRLLSSTFLHAGIVHLIGNICALASLGIFLERFTGPLRMIFVYLLSGIIASLSSVYWSGAVSVGASGSILGLSGFGIVAFTMWKSVDDGFRTCALRMFWLIALGTFATGLIYPNIDNAGHVGGFISGCLTGLLCARLGAIPQDSGAAI